MARRTPRWLWSLSALALLPWLASCRAVETGASFEAATPNVAAVSIGEVASNASLGTVNADNRTIAHAGGSTGANPGQIYALPAVNSSTGQRYFTTQFVPMGQTPPDGAVPLADALAQFNSMAPMSAGIQPANGSGTGPTATAPAIGSTLPDEGQRQNWAETAARSYPQFLAPGQSFNAGPRDLTQAGSMVCLLTFDDGPHRDLDPKVLDILKIKQVPSTFFYLGSLVQANPDIARRAVAEGHEVGQHSFDHQNLSDLTVEQVAQQFNDTTAALAGAGVRARVFRPPYGAYNADVLRQADARGMATVNWTNDSRDWEFRNPVDITNHVVENLMPGDVILLHSIQRATVAALPGLIDDLRTRGCQFTTVSRWLQAVAAS